MATGNIPMPMGATYLSATSSASIRTSLLKKATVVIVIYQTSDSVFLSSLPLLANVNTKGSCSIWNGSRWFVTSVVILWSKTNGTVSLEDSYTERSGATVSIVGYYLIF